MGSQSNIMLRYHLLALLLTSVVMLGTVSGGSLNSKDDELLKLKVQVQGQQIKQLQDTLSKLVVTLLNGKNEIQDDADHVIKKRHTSSSEDILSNLPIGALAGLRGTPGRDGRDGINGKDGIGKDGIGKDGRDGVNGINGKDGIGKDGIGKDGRDGINGKDGIGKDGRDGINGKDGAQGLQGDTGKDGDAGSPGTLGSKGASGTPGKAGITGVTGPTGITGAAGLPGAHGPSGETGSPGTLGNTGASGAPGKPGTSGAAGPSGLRGSPGVTGSPGARGPPGRDNTANAGAVYTRWGRTTCGNGSTLIYHGFTGGSRYDQRGGGVNYQCLPRTPEYNRYSNGGNSFIAGAEYESQHYGIFPNAAYDQNVPCARCYTGSRSAVMMLPAKRNCHSDWNKEYEGYLMAAYSTSPGPSTYECVDAAPEYISGLHASTNGALFWFVKPICSGTGNIGHCPPYTANKELTCVVCTK